MSRSVRTSAPSLAAPLRIGDLCVELPVALAPMAGYSDPAMRTLSRRHACGLVFTEVVNAQGINHGSRRTLHLLETASAERPVAAHIYGREPDAMARAAVEIERLGRFDLIDVNCGCPVRKIVAKGCGVALMAEPERIGRIVAAITSAVSLPVTVKTRTGLAPGRANVSEVAQAVEDGGGKAIFIHARLASSRHGGPADWEALAEVKRRRSIPVIGNGGIVAARDAVDMFRRTGVDGVMVGRAAVGNPWIFEEIRCLLRGGQYTPRSLAELRSAILEQLEHMVRLKEKEREYRRKPCLAAEQSAALHFRGHLHQYLSGLAGWDQVRRGLQGIRTPRDIIAAVDMVIAREAARTT